MVFKVNIKNTNMINIPSLVSSSRICFKFLRLPFYVSLRFYPGSLKDVRAINKFIRRITNVFYQNEKYIALHEAIKMQFPNKALITHSLTNWYNRVENRRIFLYNVKNSLLEGRLNSIQENILHNDTESLQTLKSLFNTINTLYSQNILETPTQKKDYLSGLMSLSQKQREILQGNETLSEEVRKFITKEIVHILHNFSKKENPSSLDIFNAIKNTFSAVPDPIMSQSLHNLMGKSHLPLIQALIVSCHGNTKFSYKEFKELCHPLNIDCSSFKGQDIRISHFIEAYIYDKFITALKINTVFQGTYYMVNPPGISNMPVEFNEAESKLRTSQVHSDALIIETNNAEKQETLMKLYIDMKSFVTFSSEYCRFSLFHENPKLLLRYISDMPNMIKNYIDKFNISPHNPIYNLYESLKKIRSEHKAKDFIQLREKFNRMLHIVLNAFVDKELQQLKLAFAMDAGIDSEYIHFYENVVSPYILELEISPEILVNMFPRNPVIDNDVYFITMQDVIKELLPPEIRDKALEYFQKVILPRTS